MYNINGSYSRKKNYKNNIIQENYTDSDPKQGIDIIIDTKLMETSDDIELIKSHILDTIHRAGANINKHNILNSVHEIEVVDTNEIVSNTLIWSLPNDIELDAASICNNAGFFYDNVNNICLDKRGNIVNINIEQPYKEEENDKIQNIPAPIPITYFDLPEDVVLYNKTLCDELKQYNYEFKNNKCYDPNGNVISFKNTPNVPSPAITESFKNTITENNTSVEITYSQFPNDDTDYSSKMAGAIAKSGGIPLNSIDDPITIEAPSIEENIPITDPDFYLLNKYDDKDMKIITDVTFFNKKLNNLKANDISNIISSICKDMNENCEVIFFENFSKSTKGQFIIKKLRNPKNLPKITSALIKKFNHIGININQIKI
tara:strand:- start:3632 stop:4753 length:1122 start_codon:yes stop_codon:yes gene_type:complete